ncbi:MAG: D-alanine--D-alanine ligase family protein [candidate division WOR-3 bacterium]
MMERDALLTRLHGKRVCVLVGGPSGEAEVSRRSGAKMNEALLRQGIDSFILEMEGDFIGRIKMEKTDIVCVMLHGTPGEDGTVQAALELAEIPYTGSDHFASAFAMDKLVAKWSFISNGIPTPQYVFPETGESPAGFANRVKEALGLPCVLKPRREGSSLGVIIAHDEDELAKGLVEMHRWYPLVFAERFISGKTITCGVLGTGESAFAVPALELRVKEREFYDYTAKYTKGMTDFIIPAELPTRLYQRVQSLAVSAHNLLGCKTFSRVDFVVSDEEAYILEVNTIPGMTDLSDLPAEAAACGIDYDLLALFIVASAIS